MVQGGPPHRSNRHPAHGRGSRRGPPPRRPPVRARLLEGPLQPTRPGGRDRQPGRVRRSRGTRRRPARMGLWRLRGPDPSRHREGDPRLDGLEPPDRGWRVTRRAGCPGRSGHRAAAAIGRGRAGVLPRALPARPCRPLDRGRAGHGGPSGALDGDHLGARLGDRSAGHRALEHRSDRRGHRAAVRAAGPGSG